MAAPRRYSKVRWLLSQLVAFMGSRRRFISLSLPSAKQHKLFDLHNNSVVRIGSRGMEDVISVIQVFIAEFYDLKQLGSRYDDINQKYKDILQSGKRPLIIDCGANIGLTSLYFAMMFPSAKIIAIEPDKTNCDFTKNNTVGHDVEVLEAAVGGEPGKCNIINTAVNSNSFRVEKSEVGNSNSSCIDIVTIPEILGKFGEEEYVPFIIKIDIEGFEKELFEKDASWIDCFQLLIIEFHDWMLPKEANSRNFLKAISIRDRDFMFFNENVFSVRNDL